MAKITKAAARNELARRALPKGDAGRNERPSYEVLSLSKGELKAIVGGASTPVAAATPEAHAPMGFTQVTDTVQPVKADEPSDDASVPEVASWVFNTVKASHGVSAAFKATRDFYSRLNA